MNNFSTEFKVGIFVLLSLIALAFMTAKVSKTEKFGQDTYRVQVVFHNVSGLKTGASVEVAGIDVGWVSNIALVQDKAAVTLTLYKELNLYSDSRVRIQTRGVLGDKFITIQPGGKLPQIGDGGRIVASDTSADMNEIFEKIGKAADNFELVTKSFVNSLGGMEGERRLLEIVVNLQELTAGLNVLVKNNANDVADILKNLRTFTAELKSISFASKQNINDIIDNLNQTLAHARSISQKLDSGNGSLGRLINDESTIEELDQALKGINKFLVKQDTFCTDVGFLSEIHEKGDIKSYFSIQLNPSADKFYRFAVNNDPQGRRRRNETTTEVWRNGVYQGKTVTEETTIKKDEWKFSLQMGKRWSDFVLRGGMIESTGGVGMDYLFWNDRFRLSTDFFDFRDDDRPHWKLGSTLFFHKNFFVQAGLDNILRKNTRSFFGGFGLYFSDKDLKYIISSMPLPK